MTQTEMWSGLLPLFKAQNLQLIPILGLGPHSLNQQIKNAQNFIQSELNSMHETPEIHLIGHSFGGLIARALAHVLQPKLKVKSAKTSKSMKLLIIEAIKDSLIK